MDSVRATAGGKNPADVATALTNAEHQRIGQDLTARRLTADHAAQQKPQEDARIDQQMNQVMPSAPAGA